MSADDFTSTEAVRYKRWKVLTINRVFGNIFLVVFMARNTWSTTPSWPRTRIQFTSTWTLIRLGATVFLIFNRRCWDLHTSSYFPGGGLCRKGKLCEYERAHPINLLVQEAAGFFIFHHFCRKLYKQIRQWKSVPVQTGFSPMDPATAQETWLQVETRIGEKDRTPTATS